MNYSIHSIHNYRKNRKGMPMTASHYILQKFMEFKKSLMYRIMSNDEFIETIEAFVDEISKYLFMEWDDRLTGFLICAIYDLLLYNGRLFGTAGELTDMFYVYLSMDEPYIDSEIYKLIDIQYSNDHYVDIMIHDKMPSIYAKEYISGRYDLYNIL